MNELVKGQTEGSHRVLSPVTEILPALLSQFGICFPIYGRRSSVLRCQCLWVAYISPLILVFLLQAISTSPAFLLRKCLPTPET